MSQIKKKRNPKINRTNHRFHQINIKRTKKCLENKNLKLN